MTDNSIREYIRIFESVSIPQKDKERILDFLIGKNAERKEISPKYVAAASAVAFLAVGTFLLARSSKQNINIM